MHRANSLLNAVGRTLTSSHGDIRRVAVAGDLRRGNELVSDLVLVAERPSAKKPTPSIYGDLTVHFSDAEHFGARRLLAATGSNAHLDELRNLATQKGLTLEQYGLFEGSRNLSPLEPNKRSIRLWDLNISNLNSEKGAVRLT